MKHLSAFVLDQLELGSLSDGERAAVEAHLAGCAACRAEREAAAALRRRFDQHVLPRTIERVTRPRRRRWWRWAPLVLAPALAVAALLLYLRPSPPELAYKGGPALTVYARRGAQVFVVHEGETLRPGDELRFVVAAAGQGYVLIASLDGAAQASVYHPFAGSRSAAVAAGRVELPGSVKLDGTLGHEHLYALFSAQPLDAAEVLARLARDGTVGTVAATTVQLDFDKQPQP
jgi:hypothetical protein